MSTVKLAPRDKRGKQLIKDNGPVWELLHETDYCIAYHCPAYFIRSLVNKDEARWIKLNGGPHFYIRRKT